MTPKILILTCAVSLLSVRSFAQTKVDIPLEPGEKLTGFVDLKERGFIIETSKSNDDSEREFSYYKPTLKMAWKTPAEIGLPMLSFVQRVVASPSGDFLYCLRTEGKSILGGSSDLMATQFNQKGQSKVHTIDKATLKKIKGVEMLRSCDEAYFYLVTLFEGNKRVPTQLILNRFSHQDFSFSEVTVDLPLIDANKSTSEWAYAGHGPERIWLVSKSIPKDKSAYQCQLVAINWQGQVVDKIVLNNQVAGLYLIPSQNHLYGAEGKLVQAPLLPATYTSGTPQPLPVNAHTSVLVDEPNNIIYVYGMHGKKKSPSRVAPVAGYYLTAYDLKGQQRWQKVSTEKDQLVADKQFCRRTPNAYRTTMAYVMGNDAFCLQLASVKNCYTYEFSKEGQVLAAYQRASKSQGSQPIFFPVNAAAQPMQTYYRTHASSDKTYYISFSSQGDVLVEYDNKDKLSLLRW